MITKYLLLLAIIGAGIGGTSSAHFLRKKFGPSCNITIYESGHIGGRLATTVMAGKEYEVGGSIIHSANKLMTEFLGETGNLKSFRRNINMTLNLYSNKSRSTSSSIVLLLFRIA